MKIEKPIPKDKSVSKTRFTIGATVFILGFLSPLSIPLVTNSNLSVTLKSAISGFLALGVPEIFMVIAVAIMGKSGYEFLKSKLVGYLKPLAPPDYVSLTRYRIGLFMFSTPLVIGWVIPYLAHFYTDLSHISLWYYSGIDLMFFLSFFVLGGNFWDKFSGLFKHEKS